MTTVRKPQDSGETSETGRRVPSALSLNIYMTAEAVEQAKAPMPELERLYREAVPEAVEYLGELYTLREGAYHLSKRWNRTYNG